MEKVAQVAQVAQKGGGNTKTPPPRKRARRWCFTLNNYTTEEVAQLHSTFDHAQWIFGREVGKEGTQHLQGYVEWKNACSFIQMKKRIPRAHIELAKGSKEDNYKYCSKDGDFETNITFKKKGMEFVQMLKQMVLDQEYNDVKWKPFQDEILEIFKRKADSRTIHWRYETQGNVGKSYLMKFIALRDDVIICDGKKDNIFNQINTCIMSGNIPNIILLDVPRTNENYVNYGVIEQIKSGCIYSGKYEGGKLIFPYPHVIVFANFEPDVSAMSIDRWDVKEIKTV